jgi:hypothetical protein
MDSLDCRLSLPAIFLSFIVSAPVGNSRSMLFLHTALKGQAQLRIPLLLSSL